MKKRYECTFRIDMYADYDVVRVSKTADREEAERRYRRDFYHSLGLTLYSVAWADSSADNPAN